MESTVLKEINGEVEDFKSKFIQVVPGLGFNQYETLNKIYFYYNSKFMSGDVDDDGDRKYFYNIVKNPCKVFSKAIDFDTKNIRLLTTESGDSLKTWFMERDLKYWMRDKQFGKVLNRLFQELPIYGSVVLKIVKGTPYFVDLRNFVVEQSADSLDDSNYIIEIHNFTPANFRRTAKEMKWDQAKVDEALKLFREMKGVSHLRVYERYGEVADEVNGNITYSRKRSFIADVGIDEFDNYSNMVVQHPGVVLDEQPWEDHPYWEYHAEKMNGRWLGMGVVEALFEPQIRQNEIANLQSKGSYWAALRIFQTRDGAVARNLLSNVQNGEVLNVDSEITQVNMEDRNLAFFNQETDKWLRNRDELTFSYDVVQGERLPAGTPLGSAKISISQTLSYFETIQESIALDVKEMIYAVIIPAFQKEQSAEHTLRLVGQDLDNYIQMIKNRLVLEEVITMAVKSKMGNLPFPTNHDKDMLEVAISERLKQGGENLLKIPAGFYKDVKYDVDIDITGESVDTRVRNATIFALLQFMSADPTATTDPIKRRFLYRIAEDGGVNPHELFDVESKTVEDLVPAESRRAGGGVSAPQLNANVPGQTTTTV